MIYHACCPYQGTRTYDIQRKQAALATWRACYNTGRMTPAFLQGEYRSSLSLFETRRILPFVKDIIEAAALKAGKGDIIVYTNDDIGLHPDIIAVLEEHVAYFGFCAAQRIDFNECSDMNLNHPPGYWLSKHRQSALPGQSKFVAGRDLFAFSYASANEFIKLIPDMLIGVPIWDWAAMAILHLWNGTPTCQETIRDSTHPTDLPLGYISHVAHYPVWQQRQKKQPPENIYNFNLMVEFCERMNLDQFTFNPDTLHVEMLKCSQLSSHALTNQSS